MNLVELDLDVESFSTRERYLIKRLREYRTIDADIRVQERLMNGVGLSHEPRMTAASQDRDYMTWLCKVGYDLTDEEQQMIDAMKRHLNQADFAKVDEKTGHISFTYVSSIRASNALQNLEIDDENDKMLINEARSILASRQAEPYLHLTDTEKIADMRIHERDKAAVLYEILSERKQIISEALKDMNEYFHEQYLILWHKFVRNERWQKVCEIAGRNGTPLTPDEYRWSRKKSLKQFNKWTKGL